jgi:SAM-dependent methyltransferase
MPAVPTPVRSLGSRRDDGCVVLRSTELNYVDGGEQAVLEMINRAKDVSSTGDELLCAAQGWAQTYHVHPARANVLRALALPPQARVLEIGCGCGAITRYLGEVCATVDALEPMAARAAAARARTRDLAGVEVFVGELADVPAEPSYDVVVVIGVLEYIAGGAADRAPYLDFLRAIRDRLAPGGSLVLAIENKLGAKYLAGAPEDHSDRVFDSLEDYPVGAPARTFTRRALLDLAADAGLHPHAYGAFPDYKLTRAVMGELPAAARSLYYRLPQFPSPDWVRPRPVLADERRLVRTLTEAGLELETANSLLMIAGRDGESMLWPDELCAAFYSSGRRSRFSARTLVTRAGDSVRFERSPLTDEGSRPGDRFHIAGSTHDFVAGQDLLEYIAEHRDADIGALLTQWRELLDDGAQSTPDIVPHNLVLTAGGALVAIDVEIVGDIPLQQVVRRGLLWMAHHLAVLSPAGRWPDEVRTVRDLALLLGALAGVDGDWVAVAVAEELTIQLEVQRGPLDAMDAEAWRDRLAAVFRNDLDRSLTTLPLGDRLPDQLRELADRASADRAVAAARIATLEAERDLAHEHEQLWRSRFFELNGAFVVRVLNRYRRDVERLLPRESRRRRAFDWICGRRNRDSATTVDGQ